MWFALAACLTPSPVNDPPVPAPTSAPVPTEPTAPTAPRLLINEVSSSNRTGPQDAAGNTPDWIELFNPGPDDFPLGGLTISDDRDLPDLHPLDAALVVPAGGFLLLWADNDLEEGADHLPFKLSSDGDEVGIYDGGVPIARVSFGPLLADTAVARVNDGGEQLTVTLSPTPGASNGPVAQVLGQADVSPRDNCVPVVNVPQPHVLESGIVSMSMACDTGEDPAKLGLTVLTRDPGLTIAGTAVTRNNGPADAGTVDVLYVVADPDGDRVPETARSSVSVADDWRNPDNVPVDPTLYTSEYGLPVLHLQPAGTVSQSYSETDAWFDGVHYTGTIKIRGASSSNYPKKSYTLEFEPIQIDLGEPLGRKDHLVLIANFDDSAYTRHKLVFDTWATMAQTAATPRLTPRTQFVVVYLSGAYHGLYTAIDHIDDEFVRELGFNDTGGMFKSVNHDANFYYERASGQTKTNLANGWEKKEGAPDDLSAIVDFTDFTAGSSHADFDADVDSWIDRDEFMDWFALVHWTASDDSAGKNAYLYEDPDTGLLRFVPWDFNQSFGQNWYTARVDSDTYNNFYQRNAVFWHLQDDPTTSAALEARFAGHRAPGGALDPAVLQGKLDGYYGLIDSSGARDWDRWAGGYWGHFGWARSDSKGFIEERAYIEDWIAERAVYMDSVH